MSDWHRRGHVIEGCQLTTEECHSLLRCHPSDGMNGFFVALFVKKDQNEPEIDQNTNQSYQNLTNYETIKIQKKSLKRDSSTQETWWRPLSRSKYF